jgi:ArsR family transcriptional regulator
MLKAPMSLTDQDKTIYKTKADVLAAAGHPLRLAIIEYLSEGERCVCEITEHLGARQSNVSRHLAVLSNAALVAHRKDGLKTIYRLETPCVLDFLSCVTEVLKERSSATVDLLDRL